MSGLFRINLALKSLKTACSDLLQSFRELAVNHHKPLQDESGDLCLPDVPIVHPGIGDYPFDGICGAVVAWKLAWMCARLDAGDEEGRLPGHLKSLLADLTSLAAIGTIADVVPLTEENRMIAAWGLRHIARCSIPGVEALLRVSFSDRTSECGS